MVLTLTPRAALAQDHKSVLSLHSARRDNAVSRVGDVTLQRVLGEGLAGELDYYPEELDFSRFQDLSYQEAVRDFLRSKYQGHRFDLIVADSDSTLDFVTRYRDALFADTPVVFISTGFPAVRNATGIRTRLNPRDTLDTALRIQPDTKRVVVVSGASEWDKFYDTLVRDQFKELEGRLEFTYLTGLPMRELLRQVGTLPANSIVLVNPMYEDGDGQKFLPLDVLDRVIAFANAPTYSWLSVGMGHGVVGGRMQSLDLMVQRLAELALRVLRGENPDTIPVVEIDWSVTEFDWRQLRRWGISESRLPEGSSISYKQPDAWEQYGGYIVGGGLLLVVQTALIGALLVQRRRRVRVERALRESEERFRLMADTAPVLVWRAGRDKLCDYFNRPWLEFTGRTMEQELGNGWVEGVWPDDAEHCLHTFESAFDGRQPFRMEYRLRRADGEYRWMLDAGVPRFGPDGAFAGFIGSCIDITERRETEDALNESRTRHALATAAGAVGVWDWNLDTDDVYLDSELKRLWGYEDADTPNHLTDWTSRVHPDDLRSVSAAARACIKGDADVFEIEHRIVHEDGRIRWFLTRGSVLKSVHGTPYRMVGTAIDITERKHAEEAIREHEAALQANEREIQHLAGRLIEAQDAERARIARDLHDDVSQQLAGLSIALSGLKRRLGTADGSASLQTDVASLQQRTIAIAEDVRNLSRDLHPDVLKHAGLLSALGAHCDQIRRQYAIEVTFEGHGGFESIDPWAAVCVYRVAQEALHNVVTHAEARHADVQLTDSGDSLELFVVDDGKGFDIGRTREGHKGLGLVSMNERVRLAGGTLSIVTELNKGTHVRVRIPAHRHAPTHTRDESRQYEPTV